MERQNLSFHDDIIIALSKLTDTERVGMVELHDLWKPDTEYHAGTDYVEYEKYLFKCRQTHVSQEIYPPYLVPALWERIPKPGEGTHDNPIPYFAQVGMALENGLFYTEDGVLYECFRDTGIPVYNRLEDLIDLYVRVSNQGG